MATYALNPLTAVSPLDGRYYNKIQALAPYFSEYALMRYRTLVEVRWFEALANSPSISEVSALSQTAKAFLQEIIDNFDQSSAYVIKNIEKTTNHDVKAVEYYLKEAFAKSDELAPYAEFIHFACTSEDINNLAYGMMLQDALENCILPLQNEILSWLKDYAKTWQDIPMLSKTHGQTATPTTLGKELANYYARLQRQTKALSQSPIRGKINGAVGNFNAHHIAYPDTNWLELSEQFVTNLGLEWNPYTTQIENHDYIAEVFGCINRFNRILIDCDRDIWGYISLGYFSQKLKEGEVGSSTMPHKVNPIDFENSEGNLGMANAIMSFLSQQLLTSRWQRDLVDSTLMRNLGTGLGHSMLAYQNTLKGFNKLNLNQEKLNADLENNWEVLAEAIQTVMRRYGLENPYEQLKALTRGKGIDQASLVSFIKDLKLPEKAKQELLTLTPQTYTGYATELVQKLQELTT